VVVLAVDPTPTQITHCPNRKTSYVCVQGPYDNRRADLRSAVYSLKVIHVGRCVVPVCVGHVVEEHRPCSSRRSPLLRVYLRNAIGGERSRVISLRACARRAVVFISLVKTQTHTQMTEFAQTRRSAAAPPAPLRTIEQPDGEVGVRHRESHLTRSREPVADRYAPERQLHGSGRREVQPFLDDGVGNRR
jgi:hypothetical protein